MKVQDIFESKKPFKLYCNSKAKKPYLIGSYPTLQAANNALVVYKRKNAKSRALMKEYPKEHIEDLFCDLKVTGPGME